MFSGLVTDKLLKDKSYFNFLVLKFKNFLLFGIKEVYLLTKLDIIGDYLFEV